MPVFFGGTLFEAYLLRDQLDAYIELLKRYEVKYIEVSNGTIRLSEARKLEIDSGLSRDFTLCFQKLEAKIRRISFRPISG
jgi:phosphosulfolactate synthase